MTKIPGLSRIVVDDIVSEHSPTQFRRAFFELILDNGSRSVSIPEKQKHGPICEEMWLRYGVVIGKDSWRYPAVKRALEEIGYSNIQGLSRVALLLDHSGEVTGYTVYQL